MELIDRYVAAVGRRLPRRQRADVQEELRSSLYDELEARVGAQPTEEDVVALLAEAGRPEKVAASYRPGHQYLIGPELFATFKMVVGIVVAAYAVALVLAFSLGLFFRWPGGADLADRLFGVLTTILQGSVTAVGVIVVIFAILQRLDVRPEEPEEEWEPRDLPILRDMDLVGRGEAVAGIVVPAFFLVFLNLFQDRLGLPSGPVQDLLIRDVLIPNLAWINVALLLGMAISTLLLIQGRWHGYTRVADFSADLFGIYVLYLIATDIAAERAALIAAGLPAPLPVMLTRLAYGIVGVVVILRLVETAKVLVRARRSPRTAEPLRSA